MEQERAVNISDYPIPGAAACGQRHLRVLAYGAAGARPKAYLQASLHADEIPGMLVSNHLCQLLNAAGPAITGEIILLPVANPLGLSQMVSGHLAGRYALSGAGNYNRQFPQLTAAAAARLGNQLGADAAANVDLIRAALQAVLDEQIPLEETDWLRHRLLSLALDADIVLDLHCDLEALLHVYLGTPGWPGAADLSAQLGSRATLLATESGGYPFDEAVAGPWWALAGQFPQYPIHPACLAATIELRGNRDVDDKQARRDAENIFKFLQRRGVIEGDPGPLPKPLCEATTLEAVDVIRAQTGGVVTMLAPLGSEVRPGDCVARIVDPMAAEEPQKRLDIRARSQGLLFAHTDSRFVRPGQALCKVAGAEPLADRKPGHLLSD